MNFVSQDSAEAGDVDRQQLLVEFFASWGRSYEDTLASFDLLSDDCRWIQRPIPTLVGPRAARRFLAVARHTMGLATIDVEILGIGENRQTVFVERIDHLRRDDGSLIVSAPVTGAIDFGGSQIVRWREYFDSAEFVGRAIPSVAAHGIGRVARRVAKIGQ